MGSHESKKEELAKLLTVTYYRSKCDKTMHGSKAEDESSQLSSPQYKKDRAIILTPSRSTFAHDIIKQQLDIDPSFKSSSLSAKRQQVELGQTRIPSSIPHY